MKTQSPVLKVGILHGPNLDRLGKREPHIYGTHTLQDIEGLLVPVAKDLGAALSFCQSNHEGALIDQLYVWADTGFQGVIMNPGGYCHTSVALRDAVAGCGLPVIEVHISNTFAREAFRQTSLTAAACRGAIIGLGVGGYFAGLHSLVKILQHA